MGGEICRGFEYNNFIYTGDIQYFTKTEFLLCAKLRYVPEVKEKEDPHVTLTLF